MKINIKPSNCKFIVNEKERKVICILENTKNYVLNFIGHWEAPFCLSSKQYHELELPNHFVGVATCAPEDEWNEEIGRSVAFGKLKHKINVSIFKRGNKYVDMIDNYLNRIIEQFDSYGEKISLNEQKREDWLQGKFN